MTLRWSPLICPTGVQMPVLAQNLRTEAPARFDTPHTRDHAPAGQYTVRQRDAGQGCSR